jgi:hypothetical protein
MINANIMRQWDRITIKVTILKKIKIKNYLEVFE